VALKEYEGILDAKQSSLDAQEKRIDAKLNEIEIGKASIKNSQDNLAVQKKALEYKEIRLRKLIDENKLKVKLEEL
jgi:hypothetical protein